MIVPMANFARIVSAILKSVETERLKGLRNANQTRIVRADSFVRIASANRRFVGTASSKEPNNATGVRQDVRPAKFVLQPVPANQPFAVTAPLKDRNNVKGTPTAPPAKFVITVNVQP